MLKSTLNSEEGAGPLLMKPTLYRTGLNRYRLLCKSCSDVYYVDAETFYLAIVGLPKGLDNPFCCDDCASGFNWNFAE